jgi:hypothetical protein
MTMTLVKLSYNSKLIPDPGLVLQTTIVPCQIIILEYSYDQNAAIILILVTQKIYWTCLDYSHMNWYNSRNMLIPRSSNMSKLVQNQYDTNCYDSQTCLNLFRINMIWIDMIWFSSISKLVQNQYDTNWYNSETFQDSKWKHDEIH